MEYHCLMGYCIKMINWITYQDSRYSALGYEEGRVRRYEATGHGNSMAWRSLNHLCAFFHYVCPVSLKMLPDQKYWLSAEVSGGRKFLKGRRNARTRKCLNN